MLARNHRVPRGEQLDRAHEFTGRVHKRYDDKGLLLEGVPRSRHPGVR